MASSPTFAYNRDQIIKRSLRIVGAIAAGETPGAQEVADTGDALNAMVSEWQATGLHIWKEKEATLFLQPGQYLYGLGQAAYGGFSNGFNAGFDGSTVQTGTANVCPAESLSIFYCVNAVSAGGVSFLISGSPNAPSSYDYNADYNADYSSPFVGLTPFSAGDNIGIMMSNNQIYWTTVNGPQGQNVTINGGVPYPVNQGAQVFVYGQLGKTASPCAIYRPLRILNVRRILWSSLIETMVTPMARLDYRNMPNKANKGVVTQYFYDPQLGIGQFWAWPNPVDSLSALNFTYMEPINDFSVSADYPDFPQEWINAIVWNLAEEIKLEYDVGGERAAEISRKAAVSLDRVSGWDREPESFYLGVNFDQSGR